MQLSGLYWWRWFLLVICPVDKSLFSEGLQTIPCQICCLLISLGYCLQSGDMPCWAICLAGRNSVWWQCNYHSLHLRGCSFIKGVSHHSLGQAYSILLLQTPSQTVNHTVRTCGNLWQIVFLCGGDTQLILPYRSVDIMLKILSSDLVANCTTFKQRMLQSHETEISHILIFCCQ